MERQWLLNPDFCGGVEEGIKQLQNLAAESAVKMQDHMIGQGFKREEEDKGTLKRTALWSDTKTSTNSTSTGQKTEEKAKSRI